MRNMILAIDIGNTNIVVGCIEEKKIYFIERISTNHTKTELEYAIDLKTILDIHHIKRPDIEGAIISSVVPQITNAVKLAVEKILKKQPMILGPGVKTGLNIVLDNPGEMQTALRTQLQHWHSIRYRLLSWIWEQQQLFPFWMTGNVILAV